MNPPAVIRPAFSRNNRRLTHESLVIVNLPVLGAAFGRNQN
jgi:hypothetical protein